MEEYNNKIDLLAKLYNNSYLNGPTSKNDKQQLFFQTFNSLLKQEESYLYLCPKCHIFPFIDFTESKKYIRFTCLCYANKEILIKDLFSKSNSFITDLSNNNFLSYHDIFNYDQYEGLKCSEHNLIFKYYCKTCLVNFC